MMLSLNAFDMLALVIFVPILAVEALGSINPQAISLADLPAAASDIVAGEVRGRLLVDVNS